jgi:hypothetical protein
MEFFPKPLRESWRRTIGGLSIAVVCVIGWAAASAQTNVVLYEQHLFPYPVSIVVPVQVGDEVHSFLLDTGSSGTIFDPALRGSLGPLLTHAQTSTPAGRVEISVYQGPSLVMGHGHIPAMSVGLKDMAPVRRITGYNIRGILGARAFNGAALSLDFDHQSLKFLKHATPSRDMESVELEPGPDHVSPCLLIRLGGQTLRFGIDLGYNGAIGLSKDTYAACLNSGIIRELRGQDDVSVTFGGSMRHHLARFVKGELLGRSLSDFTTSVKGDFNLVGLDFLVNFDFIIDPEHARFFSKLRKVPPAANVSQLTGATFVFDDGCLVVDQLLTGPGPARVAGLREGDRLVQLGYLKRGQFNMATVYEAAMSGVGQTLMVQALRKGSSDPIVTQLQIRPRGRRSR